MANVSTSRSASTRQTQPAGASSWYPFASLRGEIDRLFDDFVPNFLDWPRASSQPLMRLDVNPKVDVSESDKNYTISAELPGLDEKNIDVTLAEGLLTIRGEKSEEKEHKEDGEKVHWTERSYGSFQRSFRVPQDVDASKVTADFKKGVLTVSLPKSAETRKSTRKIEIKS